MRGQTQTPSSSKPIGAKQSTPQADTELSLYPPQKEVLESGLLETGFHCVLQMPTGSGKTFLARHAIQKVLNTGQKAIYLVPLKALAAELQNDWSRYFKNNRVGVFTGDFGLPGKPFPIPFEEADLLIMTPERLDACTRNWRSHWKWIPSVDLIVVDEFHLLGDAHRGARLEGALSRFLRLNPFSRVLGLSATLGNRKELADWLNGVEHSSTWRPIPLEWQEIFFSKATEKPEKLLSAIQKNLQGGGQTLVFVQSRRRAEALSHFLEERGLRVHHHHAGLDWNERRKTEEAFRTGQIDVLIATATLEMGLNLPVRQVILYDLQFFDGKEFRPLPVINVWQRAGRAGRPGLDEKGEVLLFSPKWEPRSSHYEKGDFEDIQSHIFEPRCLSEQIIAEVSSGLCSTINQLSTRFKQSLAFKQEKNLSLSKTVKEMISSGMIKKHPKKPDHFVATRLGRVAVRHMLLPETVLLFKNACDRFKDLPFFDLILVATASSDCEPLVPADYEELEILSKRLRKEPSELLQLPLLELIPLLGKSGKDLLTSIKMALILRDWSLLGEMDEIAKRYCCYPFELFRLKESAERLLLAMGSLFEKEESTDAPLVEEEIPLKEKIIVLGKMIQAGLDEIKITLTLVDGIGPKWAKNLCALGLDDLEDLAQADPDDFAEIPGLKKERLLKWTEQATELLKTRSAWSYRQRGTASLEERDLENASNIDVYRLKRARELKVRSVSGGEFLVCGGLEPHRVFAHKGIFRCDCQDFEKGNICKHILAVRLKRNDKDLRQLVQEQSTHQETLDLQNLWFSSTREQWPSKKGGSPC
jgi:helicase